MAIETWYYGYSDGVAPSKTDTGGMHDIGDGIYLSRDLESARGYSRIRLDRPGANGNSSVMQVRIDTARFRVLNLCEGGLAVQWNTYLNTGGPAAPGNFIRRGSEVYNGIFFEFLKKQGLRLADYEIIIAPDYHSGQTGRTTPQMVVLYKNKGPTALHAELLENMQLLERNGVPVRIAIDPTKVVGGRNVSSGSAIPRVRLLPQSESGNSANIPTAKLARAARGAQTRNNKVVASSARSQSNAASRWTGYAMLLSSVLESLNNKSVEHAIAREIEARRSEIDAAFDQGQGVLVILHLAVEKHSDAFRARAFQSLFLQPGKTADAALTAWRGMLRVGSALPSDAPYMDVEEYRWLIPDEF